MNEILAKYLPSHSVQMVDDLLEKHKIWLTITKKRKTRHGDFTERHGQNYISVNGTLTPHKFLITLVHEIAHKVVHDKHGWSIKPHGCEWKSTFQKLMLPFLKPEIFPVHILPLLARHMVNPLATTDRDVRLSIALREDNIQDDRVMVMQIAPGKRFAWNDGRIFVMEKFLRKRYQCTEISTGKSYVFQAQALVKSLD